MALWWQREGMLGDLQDILSHYNATTQHDWFIKTEVCKILFDALNKAWTAFNRDNYDPQRGDSSSFANMIRKGMRDNSTQELLSSREVADLAKLKPPILDHNTLKKEGYTPNTPIQPDLLELASSQHRELKEQYAEYNQSPTRVEKGLVRKLARLLYVVRSNIAHGEKTPYGPDRSKMERDESVSGVVIPVQRKILDLLLDNPNQKLVVYGTLAPSEANEDILKDLQGVWQDCIIRGNIELSDGLKYFDWIPEGSEVRAKIFFAVSLPSRLPLLDSFEGSNYRRIWIPALVDGTYHVACVYSRSFSHLRN